MFKIIITLCIIAIAAASSINKIDDNVKVELLVVDDIEEYKKAHPFSELTPLSVEITPDINIRHSIGKINEGDRLVAAESNGNSWTSPQDAQIKLQYPTSGAGAVLSYVEIIVDQSSNVGNAYVINGGIGQRHITVIVQARSTIYFIYSASFWGQ